MFLQKENGPEAMKFVTGGLWLDIKKALMARRPPAPGANVPPSEAAQQFFMRQGFEMAIEAIEKLPRDMEPTPESGIPASLLDTAD